MHAAAQGFSQPYNGSSASDMSRMLDYVEAAPGRWSAPQPSQQVMQPTAMQAQNRRAPMMPRPTRRDVMRVFFEGGSLSGGGAGGGGGNFGAFSGGASAPVGNSNAASVAYSNYRTAANEAIQARNWAEKARYNSDKWVRKDSATRAEYAANNANYAAQRAESAAYNGDASARGYASSARAEANRARQSANQARYNADSIR